MVEPPSVVAWSSKVELDKLKSWFYDPQLSPILGEPPLDLRQRAIQRVQAYQSRSTNLPSEIVSTALLTQALLLPPSSPPLVFRTSMTLALIRFVNSLLDPLQKRDKSLPLSILAAGANLPTVFVEIRHWGTHESNLPGTEVLRDMGIRALEWLWRNYWNKKDDSIDVIAAWKSGSVDTMDVVAALRDHQDTSFGRLLEGLSADDDFAVSQKSWGPLLSSLHERSPAFPETFIDYIVQTLIATPTYSFSNVGSILALKHPTNLLSWTMYFLSLQSIRKTSSQCDFISIAKQCLHHPHTLAWELLRRILEEKPFVQAQLPFDLVNWIIYESRQDTQSKVPSKVDEIEKEVHKFRQRFESDNINKENRESEIWTKGWKKWEGEWIPRPHQPLSAGTPTTVGWQAIAGT